MNGCSRVRRLISLLCLILSVALLLGACRELPPDQGEEQENAPNQSPEDNQEDDPMNDKYVALTQKGDRLYEATYQTMLDRLQPDGYAATSLTGAYQGMFVRDASIQVMSHIAEGDLEQAKRILQYMAAYHKTLGKDYALHIMNPLLNDRCYDYIAGKMQPTRTEELSGEGTVISQTEASTALYRIVLPGNQAAQEFVAPFRTIKEISVYLDISATVGTLRLSVGKTPGDDSIGKATLDIAKVDRAKHWMTFIFDTPLAVKNGETYCFTIAASDTNGGNVVATGKAGDGASYNYDLTAYGGWQKAGNTLAYQIRSDSSITGEGNALTQSFTTKGDRIETITIGLTAEKKTTVHAVLTDAAGKTIKQVSVPDAETGEVVLDFDGLMVVEGAQYALRVWVESGYAVWDVGTTVGEAYRMENGEKVVMRETYTLSIAPEYSGSSLAASVTLGGETVAVQQLPDMLKDQKVTSASLYLSAVGMVGEDDTVTISLLRGDVLVDAQTYALSTLTEHAMAYDVQFCLPLADVDENDAYSICVSASREGSVCWYGRAADDLSWRVGCSDVFPLSEKIQVDGHYMWMNSYAMFVLEAEKLGDGRYDDFIKESYPLMREYTEYFFEADCKTSYYNNSYLNPDNGLMFNPSYEHSRDGRYWEAFDLITNVYASEAAHKMAQVAQHFGTSADVAAFDTWADDLADAIHEGLICEFEGKTIYTELIAVDEDYKVYKGFSFVSLAPMAADWYATDEAILANTYAAYRGCGTENYSGIPMLAVVVALDDNDQVKSLGNHVIGKGFAWELFYVWKTGDAERVEELIRFMNVRSTDVYPEVWVNDGGRSDSANQEHANWILYTMARITGKYQH